MKDDNAEFLNDVRAGKKAGEDKIHVIFAEPVRAVTKGQAVVLYKEDYVALGGVIL